MNVLEKQLTNRDVVIVIHHDEISQLQMARRAGSLAGDTFHSTPVSEEAECVIVDKLETRLVEFGSSVSLGNGKANSIGKTLTKRTRGHFDTRCILSFWMSRGDTVNLLKAANLG